MTNKKNCLMPIHLACAGKDEKFRESCFYIHFIDGFAWATDSHILVKQSLSYYDIENKENLEGKMIHKDFFKNLYTCKKVVATEEGIRGLDDKDNICAFYPFETKVSPFKFIQNTETFNYDIKELEYINIQAKYVDLASKILYKDNCEEYLKLSFCGCFVKMTTEDRNDQFALIMRK